MILRGDCIEVMKALKPNSVDAVVTDPPYGLEFMGKEWDKLRNTWQAKEGRYHNDTTFLAKGDRIRYQAGLEMQLWHTQWLTEAYRVLKPGASMLVMGGTRTFHRLMVAIEDSGFIIKDCLMWIYGSGFPKCQDITPHIDAKVLGITTKQVKERRKVVGIKKHSDNFNNAKANKVGYLADPANRNNEKCFGYGEEKITIPLTDLAKHWDGFKIGGIKPAYEPIVWAVKPPEGSYIDNVLKWGVGAVNVDECRVQYQNDDDFNNASVGFKQKDWKSTQDGWRRPWQESKDPNESRQATTSKGRFPANVILDEEAGRVMDEQSGESKSSPVGFDKAISGGDGHEGYKRKSHDNKSYQNPSQLESNYSDSGGASRFFYCAKASRGERGKDNKHPTVKPIALFEWLIKLVTREGQIVLDPFLGSGTTAIAAHKAGRECVGIEREDDYVEIAKRRIDHWQSQPQQGEL